MSGSTPRARARAPRGEVRPPEIRRGPDDVAPFLEDAAHHRGHAEAVAFPETEGEWAWLLAQGEPVLAVGAQSSLTRGATPAGGLVASTGRMRALLDVSGGRARCQPGLTLEELLRALAARGLAYPPAPTWTGATVGGVVSTNAAGAATFKHGTTRRWVRGLTVVLAGGDVLELERGRCLASDDGRFEIERADGRVAVVPVPSYRLPDVPKRSAGYHAEPGMDLVDLFVGSEGTLGVVTEVELDVVPRRWDTLGAVAFLPDEAAGLALAGELREASRRTWSSRDPRGLDVAALEHADARSLALLDEEGATSRLAVSVPRGAGFALFVQAELPRGHVAADEVASLDEPGSDGPVLRLLRALERHGARREDVDLALPEEPARLAAHCALREAVPLAVNALLGRRQREDPRVHKAGGDVIVPFGSLPELLASWRSRTAEADLDALHWGHVSDGNVHPNVLPRSGEEMEAALRVQLEIGREALRLGGCPMAEHGVGRHPLKQRLLREMLGERGLEDMKAVRRALDPGGILAPGVLW